MPRVVVIEILKFKGRLDSSDKVELMPSVTPMLPSLSDINVAIVFPLNCSQMQLKDF